MYNWHKDIPKVKKGKWFVKTRGSYLPATPQAWLLHIVLFMAGIGAIFSSFTDSRSLIVVSLSLLLELIGLGAIFSYIAAKTS